MLLKVGLNLRVGVQISLDLSADLFLGLALRLVKKSFTAGWSVGSSP